MIDSLRAMCIIGGTSEEENPKMRKRQFSFPLVTSIFFVAKTHRKGGGTQHYSLVSE